MTYTVKKVSGLSGVSVRTLHYYDEIGLLKPTSYGENGYRYYEEDQLLKLQQILFFRELDFSLSDIQAILESNHFNRIEALRAHRQLLKQKVDRMNELMKTIDKTIDHLKGEYSMADQELYEGFSREQQEKYEIEIKERYGTCGEELFAESKSRMKNWTKADYSEVKQKIDELHQEFVTAIVAGMAIDDSVVQKLVRKHYNWINTFYAPTKEVYSGLGNLYVNHPDFRKMYDTHHPQLAEFLRDAMAFFAEYELK